MSLRDGSKIFIAAKILQWMDTILIVLLPDFSGELNSTIIGFVYLYFPNFISVACLIIRSRMSVLYRLCLVRDSVPESTLSPSRYSSVGCIVWSSFVGVFVKFAVFCFNF